MIIDAQAIEHLDILPQPTPASKVIKVDGSLFSYLSKDSVTPFGKRMLKRWTVSPLTDVNQIRDRLDAVEELSTKDKLRRELSGRLRNLPDIERILTKIYTYSVKQKVKAFYIDAQALNRLDEFYDLLATLRELNQILKDVFHKKAGKVEAESLRLRRLVTFKKVIVHANADTEMQSQQDEEMEEGIFPDYMPILDEFEEMIVWKQYGNKKIPEPKKGVDEEFDNKNDNLDSIKK